MDVCKALSTTCIASADPVQHISQSLLVMERFSVLSPLVLSPLMAEFVLDIKIF